MIQLRGINKTYFNGAPLHVLKGINLDIEKGEMVSIMGASGSGKSTLLNILGILDTYDTGTYQLNGQLIQNLSESRAAELRNRMIGFIFQSSSHARTPWRTLPSPSIIKGSAGKRGMPWRWNTWTWWD